MEIPLLLPSKTTDIHIVAAALVMQQRVLTAAADTTFSGSLGTELRKTPLPR
jgi:hypothetical protein